MDMVSNCLLNTYIYAHKLVLLETESALLREASVCNGRRLRQRVMAGRGAENVDGCVPPSKRSMGFGLYKAQGTSQTRREKRHRGQRMGQSSTVRCCLLDMTG